MKKFLYYLPSIIFNVAETLVVFLVGKLLELSLETILIIISIFGIFRILCKPALHYKDWYRCLVWCALFFLSLFVVVKASFLLSIFLTMFEAVILTKKGNISDIFLWGGNRLNKEVFDWVKYNKDNDKLAEYENRLKETDKRKYYIYVYRFKEFKSYSEISELMDLDAQRVSDEIKIISHFIEYSIRLNSENKNKNNEGE